jgi:hypothetical protein
VPGTPATSTPKTRQVAAEIVDDMMRTTAPPEAAGKEPPTAKIVGLVHDNREMFTGALEVSG